MSSIKLFFRFWTAVSQRALEKTLRTLGVGRKLVVPITIVIWGFYNYFQVFGGKVAMEELGKFLWGTAEPAFFLFLILPYSSRYSGIKNESKIMFV